MALTDFQSAGRGRHGRRWEAPAGTSLLFSLLFRPPWPADQASWLMMLAGIAAVHAVRQTSSLEAALKWPNDVMVRITESWRKAGGLLLETTLAGERIDYVIAGIGINANVAEDELPQTETAATSLLAATGRTFDRVALLGVLLQQLEALYEAAAAGQSPHAEWDALLLARNRPVIVSSAEQVLRGTATGTDPWGRLLVQDDQGRVHAVAAGDVTLQARQG